MYVSERVDIEGGMMETKSTSFCRFYTRLSSFSSSTKSKSLMACGHYFGIIHLTDCGGVRQVVYRYTVSLLVGVGAVL